MTTTRRRKAPTRSVAIRRVKPIAKRKERKTQKRKSRNKVMRGGAGDILLYYKPGVNPPNCIIIKEKLTGRKDNLYLFFAANITSDQVTDYVCKAMGLADSVKFKPEFEPQKNDDMDSNGRRKYGLNNLFVRLRGVFSYTTIESGYLQRGDNTRYNVLVTSKEHKITPELTSASEIKSWEVVVRDKLQFQQYKDFQYVELTSHVAEQGYFLIGYEFRPAQETAEDACRKQMSNILGRHRIDAIKEAKQRIGNWPDNIKKSVAMMFNQKMSKKEAEGYINTYLTANYNSDYDSDVRKLRNYYDELTSKLSPECEEELKSHLGLDKFKTIQEMVDEAYAGNSSEISSQP